MMMLTDEVRETIKVALNATWQLVVRWGDAEAEVAKKLGEAEMWIDAQPQAPSPVWADAPEWAQWWTVDNSGYAWWSDKEPQLYAKADIWDVPGHGTFDDAGYHDLPVGVDWRTLKRKRPEAPDA